MVKSAKLTSFLKTLNSIKINNDKIDSIIKLYEANCTDSTPILTQFEEFTLLDEYLDSFVSSVEPSFNDSLESSILEDFYDNDISPYTICETYDVTMTFFFNAIKNNVVYNERKKKRIAAAKVTTEGDSKPSRTKTKSDVETAWLWNPLALSTSL